MSFVAGRIKRDVCLLGGVIDQNHTNLLKLIAATNSDELHLPVSLVCLRQLLLWYLIASRIGNADYWKGGGEE